MKKIIYGILFLLLGSAVYIACDEDGNLDEELANQFCVVIQQWVSISLCQETVQDIIAEQESQEGCPDPESTGDIQPFTSATPWTQGLLHVIYRTPGVSSSVQCKSSWIQKDGVPLPDSVETVLFADADIGDFENFNGDLQDQTNIGIPPHYYRIQTDTVNLNDTEDENGNIIFDDMIIYLSQGTDKWGGVPNVNAKCNCSTFPNFCKRIYVEDCLTAFEGIDTFGLKGIVIPED